MDIKRKKQLIEEYENRKPEMGIISFCCIATGESFFGVSKDTKADFNSNRFKLNANWHPNKRLSELWKQYGENGFELSVAQVLKYEDTSADHSEELEKMLIQCLESNDTARRIWK
ncbi:GIY-YIG nuclease family protein [Eubacteriales bacterium OttesenSCG-928-K08]|nr:GIY-YIG nuclease family protein [Eubacteriales bacterium OttesenSCG-928-K08]MDL2288608.1 GIY-YIG nuclease family protein [Oscillospiraceae bacterium OttesenSCG-928-F05]MDL2300083.1 GIY-YIG nuclease family protein [Clostridiaceae bacterium OttesenSCG-928-D20]